MTQSASQSTPQFVTADTNIQEAVMRYPVTAEIMMSYGLACVGCHISAFETIKQGAMGHGGMDDDDVEELIKEMNEAIAQKEVAVASDAPLVITNKAAAKIKEFSADEEQEGIFLRVAVIPGGCSGFSYHLDFEHDAKDDDVVLDADGFPVRLSADSLDFLKGAILDYVDGLSGSGFKFENPNASSKCGCEKSFS